MFDEDAFAVFEDSSQDTKKKGSVKRKQKKESKCDVKEDSPNPSSETISDETTIKMRYVIPDSIG